MSKGAFCKTSSFAQSLRQAQISILKIRPVFLRLKSSPSLTLAKIDHFAGGSKRVSVSVALLLAVLLACCTGAPPKPSSVERERALSYAGRGVEWFNKGCYSRALSLFEESLRINQAVDNPAGAAYDYNNIGMIALKAGDAARAREFFTIALRMQQGLNNDVGLSVSLGALAAVDLREGNQAAAGKYLEEAYQAALRSKDRLQQAVILNMMGHLSWEKGALEKANEYVMKASAIYEAEDQSGGMAASYHNLGLIRMSEDKPDAAEALFDRALHLDQEILNYPGIAADLEMVARLHLKRENWPSVVNYGVRAFNVYYSIGYEKDAAAVLDIIRKAEQAGHLEPGADFYEAKLKEMTSPDFDVPCRQ